MSALKRSVARDTKAAPGTRGSAKKRKPAGTRKTAAKKIASGRKSR
jgi:hypothetical protein